METKCNKCGSEKLYILDKKPHLHLRCQDCNTWIKFIKKQDLALYRGLHGFPRIEWNEESLNE